MDRSESQATSMKFIVKQAPIVDRLLHVSLKRKRSDDYCSRDRFDHKPPHMSRGEDLNRTKEERNKDYCSRDRFHRPLHMSRGDGDSYRRKDDGSRYCSGDRYHQPRHISRGNEDSTRRKDEKGMSDTKIGLPDIRVNQRGEPYGQSEMIVSNQLTSIVRKYVRLETMWSSVSKEVKYDIDQELRSRFRDGGRIDSSWIKSTARKAHTSARNKAKTAHFNKHFAHLSRPAHRASFSY